MPVLLTIVFKSIMPLSRKDSCQNIDGRELKIENYKILHFNNFILLKTRQNPIKHALNFVSFSYNRLIRLKRTHLIFKRKIFLNRFYARVFASPLSYRLKNVLRIELVQTLKSRRDKMCKTLNNVELSDSNQESKDSLNQSQTILVENKDSGQRSGRDIFKS